MKKRDQSLVLLSLLAWNSLLPQLVGAQDSFSSSGDAGTGNLTGNEVEAAQVSKRNPELLTSDRDSSFLSLLPRSQQEDILKLNIGRNLYRQNEILAGACHRLSMLMAPDPERKNQAKVLMSWFLAKQKIAWKNPGYAANMHFDLASLNFELHDFPEAEKELLLALDLLLALPQQTRNLKDIADTLAMLGSVNCKNSKFTEAQNRFEKAGALYDLSIPEQRKARIISLYNAALLACYNKANEQASNLMAQAADLAENAEDLLPAFRSRILFESALIYFNLSNYKQAKSRAFRGLAIIGIDPSKSFSDPFSSGNQASSVMADKLLSPFFSVDKVKVDLTQTALSGEEPVSPRVLPDGTRFPYIPWRVDLSIPEFLWSDLSSVSAAAAASSSSVPNTSAISSTGTGLPESPLGSDVTVIQGVNNSKSTIDWLFARLEFQAPAVLPSSPSYSPELILRLYSSALAQLGETAESKLVDTRVEQMFCPDNGAVIVFPPLALKSEDVPAASPKALEQSQFSQLFALAVLLKDAELAESVYCDLQNSHLDFDYLFAKEFDELGNAFMKSDLDLAIKWYRRGNFHSPGKPLDSESSKLLDECLKLKHIDPGSFDVRVKLGKAAIKDADLQTAVVEYESALLLKDDNALKVELGCLWNKLGQTERAISIIKSANLDSAASTGLASLLLLQNKFVPARAAFQSALVLDSANMEAAQSLLQMESQCVSKSPADPANHVYLAQALVFCGQMPEALAEYKVAQVLDPKNIWIKDQIDQLNESGKSCLTIRRIAEIESLRKRGCYVTALAEAEAAQKMNPQNAYLALELGNIYFRLGDFAKAIQSFDHCLSLDPDFLSAKASKLRSLVFRLKDASENSNGSRPLSATIANYNVHFLRGTRLDALGEDDKALSEYEKALALDPKNADYKDVFEALVQSKIKRLQNTLSKDPKNKSAISSLQKTMLSIPNDSTSWFDLGAVLFRTANYNESVVAFEKARLLDPQKLFEASYWIGLCDEILGLPENAVGEYKKFVAVAPEGDLKVAAEKNLAALSLNSNDTINLSRMREILNAVQSQQVFKLAQSAWKSKNEKLVKQYCQRAFSLTPVAQIAFTIGQVSSDPESVTWYSKALELDPNNAEYQDRLNFARSNYANGLWNEGAQLLTPIGPSKASQPGSKLSKSLNLFSKAVDFDPENGTLRMSYAEQLRAAGKLSSAIDQAKLILNNTPSGEQEDELLISRAKDLVDSCNENDEGNYTSAVPMFPQGGFAMLADLPDLKEFSELPEAAVFPKYLNRNESSTVQSEDADLHSYPSSVVFKHFSPYKVKQSSDDNIASQLSNSTAASSSPATAQDVDFGPYMAEVQRLVKNNWFAGKAKSSRRAVVLFKVHVNGDTSDVKLDKSSGSDDFDRSCMNASLLKLPPLPVGAPPVVDIQYSFDQNVFGFKPQDAASLTVGTAGSALWKSDSTSTNNSTFASIPVAHEPVPLPGFPFLPPIDLPQGNSLIDDSEESEAPILSKNGVLDSAFRRNNIAVKIGMTGNWPFAIREHEAAINEAPERQVLRTNLSGAHLEFGKQLESRSELSAAIGEYRLALGVDLDNGSAESGVDRCMTKMALDPYSYELRGHLADEAASIQDYLAELLELRKCNELRDDPLSQLKLAKFYLKIGMLKKATELFISLAARSDWANDQVIERAESCAILGSILNQYSESALAQSPSLIGKKRLTGAALLYRRAATLNPKNLQSLSGLLASTKRSLALNSSSDNKLAVDAATFMIESANRKQVDFKLCPPYPPSGF